MTDLLREIGATIKKNKLRTFLTGFSIAWGIFMLIALLGSGNGLKNGIESNFADRAKNVIMVSPGYTSVAYGGLPIDRAIKLDQRDLDFVGSEFPEIDYITGVIQNSSVMTYDKNYGVWGSIGVNPDAAYINNIQINSDKGRFINDIDVRLHRKIIVINNEIEEILFPDKQNPLGKYILIDKIAFLIVGVYKDVKGNTNVPAYIPLSTAQILYNRGQNIDKIDFTVKDLNTLKKNEDFSNRFRERMAFLHRFDPSDKSAISVWNMAKYSVQTTQLFNMITIFIWVIGFLSLVAGIVGVSNIMLITVKERTREFGIRKAIGASPFSILRLVLIESIMVTAVFGFTGMILGIGLMEFINNMLESAAKASSEQMTVFLNPTVDITTVTEATIILIVAGALAGCIPAIRAIKISPVEAMRSE